MNIENKTVLVTAGAPPMNDRHFTTTISVDESPAEAFAAIRNVRGWWSENLEGGTDKLGDEFTFSYKDVHRSRMKVTEVIPDEMVAWSVSDSYIKFAKNHSEWTGTEICFAISRHGDKTEIRFDHFGLVPEYECFDLCSSAWGSYINGSLRSLITTGKGKPNPKE